AIVLKKTRTLLLRTRMPAHRGHLLCIGAADSTPAVDDGSVSLVVTSPPFLDIVHYAADNWLRCWFAGIDTGKVDIAMHRTEEGWAEMVRSVLTEQAGGVGPGGHVVFGVGEVRGGRVLLERLVWKPEEGLPFDRRG